MSEHTPTPWSIDAYDEINGPNGKRLFVNGVASALTAGEFMDIGKANAAFIVKAVNSYDDLVAALRRIASMDVDRFNTEEPRNVALSALACLNPPPPANPRNHPIGEQACSRT